MSIEVKHHAPIVYKVYEEMKSHVGNSNAISADDLCDKFGDELLVFDPIMVDYKSRKRKLRKIIREIRRSGELEKVIGSCKNGYFICTQNDAQKAIDRLMNAAKNQIKTASIMAKKVGLNNQMKIQMGQFYRDTYQSLMEDEDD